MFRLSLMRVALFLFFTVGIVEAQEKPAQFTKVFVTVTNKGDFDLSLSLTLQSATQPVPPPSLSGSISNTAHSSAQTLSNNVAPFQVQRIVKPQQQTTFTIPRGDYIVEAITASQHEQEIIRQMRDPSNPRENSIINNEIWTYELDKGTKVADNTQPAGKLPMSHTWKRHIWPVRQLNTSGPTELRAAPQRPQRLERSEAQESSLPKTKPAPPQNLRVVVPQTP